MRELVMLVEFIMSNKMNFKELLEGAEPVAGGIQIMAPQQFVARAGECQLMKLDEDEVK
jgi:hypothetical protein